MRPPLYPYQLEDAARLVDPRPLLLGLQVGLGKSRIVVEAASHLLTRGALDTVLIVCPAPVRPVWADPNPQLGEWAKWADPALADTVEYTSRTKFIGWDYPRLVIVTNPELIRRSDRLKPLIALLKTRRTLLVLDESWQFANSRAQQTRAVMALRQHCPRVVELNGTPGAPDKLYSQFHILHPSILECRNFFHFKARYCRMGGWQGKEIVGYQRMDEFAARTAPFAIYRQTRDYLDLGLPPVRTQIEARLTPATWRIYRQMERDLFTWLDEHTSASASMAAVQALRLAQIANGFVGGVARDLFTPAADTQEIGAEKLSVLQAWLEDSGLPSRLLIFTRFRRDVERTADVLASRFPLMDVAKLYGDQKPEDRRAALTLLAPDSTARGIVVANAQSGGAGLNLCGASTCIFLANDFSLKTRAQAEGRVDRLGQTERVTYVDVLATGPDGQRTIDHAIAAALRAKEDVATWTAEMWRRRLHG